MYIFRVIFQLMNTYGFYVIFKLTFDKFELFFILIYYRLVLYTDLNTTYFFELTVISVLIIYASIIDFRASIS